MPRRYSSRCRVARVGGEEFMVLPNEAVRCSSFERGRGAVAAEASYVETGRIVSVTVSFGVSEFGRDGDTIDTLLRVADERLYPGQAQ